MAGMEAMTRLFESCFKGKTVLVTGNTGFKGSWLCLWLENLGARVIGYALNPPTEPSHYELLSPTYNTIIADIRDYERLLDVIDRNKPEIIFHLAAQPLVRYSYEHPAETMEVNILGTLHVLEACRQCAAVQALVIVTSDKCYANQEWIWGYRENDLLGGSDPYSASKGCAEIIAASYRKSYFSATHRKGRRLLIATARAGNVVGGGDWREDRLVPDIMTAAARGEAVAIRNPHATRPWQHVLEPLSGYLWLGSRLLQGQARFAEAWNFGPGDDVSLTVEEVVERMGRHWNRITPLAEQTGNGYHESTLLQLDISKARNVLRWRPTWDYGQTIEKTALWYREYYEHDRANMAQRSLADLSDYVRCAQAKKIAWSMGND